MVDYDFFFFLVEVIEYFEELVVWEFFVYF